MIYRIDQIVESVSKTHKFDKKNLIAVNTSDVLNGDFLDPKYLPTKLLKGQFKKTIEKNDILFSEIRPINKRFALVKNENVEDYVVSTKMMVLRKFNDEVDLKYFYYYLTNESFLKILQKRAENRICSFPQITFELLSEYKIDVPKLDVQQKISKILDKLNEKIAINKNINDNL